MASRKPKALNFSLPVSKQLPKRARERTQRSLPASAIQAKATLLFLPPSASRDLESRPRHPTTQSWEQLLLRTYLPSFQARIRRAKFRFPLLRLSLPSLLLAPLPARRHDYAAGAQQIELPARNRLACFDGFCFAWLHRNRYLRATSRLPRF